MDGRTGVGVAALLCALMLLTGCTPDPAVAPSPSSSSPSATPSETDAERQERLDYAAAEKAYRTFRAEYGRVLRAGGAKEPTKVMKETAGGEYLKQLGQIARAYEGVDAHNRGRERIVYVRQSGYAPEALSLKVCEDGRDLRTEADGRSLRGEIRVANLTVRKVKDVWKVWSGEGQKVSACD